METKAKPMLSHSPKHCESNSELITQNTDKSPYPYQPLCLSTHGETPDAGGGEGKPPEWLIWHHLTAGLAWLPDNSYGRPWPNPNRATIRRCLSEYEPDLCVAAAREAREIVIAQDRAPNITALFEKKCRDLAEVRDAVRDGLGAA